MKRYIRWEEIKVTNDEDDDESESERPSNMQMVQLLNARMETPFGNYQLDSQFNPMNDRIILIGNTNFDLTTKLIKSICEIDGVESVRVFSRYSMIVMIGVLFDESSVVRRINSVCEIIDESISIEDLSLEESNIILNASENNKYWLAYLFPNGKEYIETFESLDKLEESIPYFKELSGFSEGKMFSSEKLEKYLEDDEDNENDI